MSAHRPTSQNSISLYDTTLRDGTQQQGLSLTLEDKLKCAKLLDQFGMHYIEGGWPGSNPKDSEFFVRARDLDLSFSTVTAFGSTRRAQTAVEDDFNIKALLGAHTAAVTLVGKSSQLHVEQVLETTLEENIAMIDESVRYMKENGKEVIYDAEHFFDGFIENEDYCRSTLQAAVDAGADWIVLCDTNGGTLPSEVARITKAICESFSCAVGIHTHNDCETAVANSLSAIAAGATQVQGTVNGYGERCGNANLVALIPSLQSKLGYSCVTEESLAKLTSLSQRISEIANHKLNPQAAYVGSSAFAHKGGLHVAAVEKVAKSYEHIEPEAIGNKRGSVISELSGRGNVRVLAQACGVELGGSEKKILKLVKDRENKGYQFENAEGSVELLIRRQQDGYAAPFCVKGFIVVSEQRSDGEDSVEAIVKLLLDGRLIQTTAQGEGPLNALDNALRKALLPRHPELADFRLSDYKVRILDPDNATSAIARVCVEASTKDCSWTTVSCSKNVIDASFYALVESYELFLLRQKTSDSVNDTSLHVGNEDGLIR